MTRNPTTVLFALFVGMTIGASAALAQSSPPAAAPQGVDPATHAAHIQQNPATHAPGVQPGSAGDASADLASQVAALREEVAEIRMMLKQQYAAPARANTGGGAGMSTVPKQPGGGQMAPMQPMQPQPSRRTGGMAGMSAGGTQPAAPGMAMGGKSKMKRPTATGQAQPIQPMQAQPGHPAPHAAAGDGYSDLVSQLAVMRADVSRFQAALAQKHTPHVPAAASGGMGQGMGGKGTMQKPMGMGQMQPMPAQPAPGGAGAMPMMDDDMMEMGGMGTAPPPSPPAGGQPASGGMGMMDDDMMEMGGMGGGAPPPGGGMGGMGGMSGGAGGGGMGMNGMMKMMGMGDMPMGGAGSPAAMAMPSALPGFPGASHIYHIGATGFFLDHPEHITLTLEQQTALSQKKEQALLQQAQYQRRVEEAEQELWVLTAADQPDAAAIDTKVQQIATLQGQQRIAFIRAAGEAAKVLTDEQRKQLTGMLPPVPRPMPMTPAPAAPAMPAGGGMPDM